MPITPPPLRGHTTRQHLDALTRVTDRLRMPCDRAPRVPLIRGPLCYAGHPRVAVLCTRARGHGARHAATGHSNIVSAVWEQT